MFDEIYKPLQALEQRTSLKQKPKFPRHISLKKTAIKNKQIFLNYVIISYWLFQPSFDEKLTKIDRIAIFKKRNFEFLKKISFVTCSNFTLTLYQILFLKTRDKKQKYGLNQARSQIAEKERCTHILMPLDQYEDYNQNGIYRIFS